MKNENKIQNQTPGLKISYLNFPESDAVSFAVTKKAEKLFHLYDRILHCQVTLSCPHRHRRSDRLFRVQIHLHIPGKDIVVSPRADNDESHRDIYVAIADSFHAAERILQDQVRIQRHQVKFHQDAP